MSALSTTQLGSILAHAKKHEKIDPRDELTKKAQQLVSQNFFGTMLKEAHKSPFHSDEFEGGKGGAAYQELFDQKIAEHMSRGVGSKIVRPMVHKLQANKAYAKHIPSKHNGSQGGGGGGGGSFFGSHAHQHASHSPLKHGKSQSHQASAFLANNFGV